MEPSHYASDLDPSSVLGFGSALTLLEAPEEVGRLLTGALRSMEISDLQAVVLNDVLCDDGQVVGSVGTTALSDAVVEELQRMEANAALNESAEEPGLSRQLVEVDETRYPALAEEGLRQLSLLRLGTIEAEFGIVVAGHTDPAGQAPIDGSALQMMTAQASMALRRIQVDRERAAKAEALQESEARYRTLYENAPVAYVSTAPDGTIRMANERATALLGAAKEDLIGRAMPHFCLKSAEPADEDAAQRLGRHLRDGGPMRDTELQLCRADGEKVWVSLTMRPIDTPDENAERLVMMIDVTERKRVERALRESEERLTRIIDSAIDAIISITADLEIRLFNRAAKDIFQCQGDDVTCASLAPFLTDPFEALVRRHIEQHQEGEGNDASSPGQYLAAPEGLEARRADGETFPVEATLCPVQLPEEDQYLLILRDLNELKQAEEEVDQLQSQKIYLQEELKSEYNFDGIVGTSPPMQKVFNAIERVADIDTTVLITGETGTGKELVARSLHERSERADQVFVKVNCAALSSDLIESELFGHEKGAFTGATEQRKGRFEVADGGTLLLDEIGELPLDTQAKLLRVLQHQEFERVGGSRTIEVDARILAATNRDLEAEVDAGRFRSDLYYRLNIFPIELPPLRDRKEDISLLAKHFCNMYCQRGNTTVTSITPNAMAILKGYDWPGNVRELANIIERAVILTRDDEIRAEHLSISEGSSPDGPTSFATLEEMQRQHIENALERTDGVVGGEEGAAQLLDVKRTTLLSRMDRLGIEPSEYRT